MMHRKMRAQQTRASLSLSPANVFEELNKYDPIKEIFNGISLSDNALIPRNKFDYAAPKSSVKASEIWYQCHYFSLPFSLSLPNLAESGSQKLFPNF